MSETTEKQANESQNESKPMFGITTETRSKGISKILPPQELDKPTKIFPQGFKFPIAYLESVKFEDEYETKNGKTKVLIFTFIDNEDRQHLHIEWEVDFTDANFETKKEGMSSRIKHIYEQFSDFPKEGIGTKATSFKEFFKSVEKAFSKIDTQKYCFIKLVYYKGNLNFPLYPNFLQLVEKDKPCKLEIGKRDNIKTKAGNSEEGSLPDMPNDTPGFEDFD